MQTRSFTVAEPTPLHFDLETVTLGHGWIDLAPFVRGADGTVRFTMRTPTGPAHASVSRGEGGLRAVVRQFGAPTAADRRAAKFALRRVFGLNDDLTPFWAACDKVARLHWVSRLGAGRLMRAPTLFEDLVKILFTTNCAWGATRTMCLRLIDRYGEEAPGGARVFPAPERIADAEVGELKATVRCGYRAPSLLHLAELAAGGALDSAPFVDVSRPIDERRKALLSLPGFGPYAAGQALRLLGAFDDLALDSWCRARIQDLLRARGPLTDADVARRYARFGNYRGLAMWMDLTKPWHAERLAGH